MFKGRPLLRTGVIRPEVKVLEEALIWHGYIQPGENLWFFGKEMEERVRNFQRDHSLEVDGIVGPQTWEVLLLNWEDSEDFEDTLVWRIMSLITTFELGFVRNPYGTVVGDIGDGAGTNYGCLQWNNFSIKYFLSITGNEDFYNSISHLSSKQRVSKLHEFFSSPKGVRAQNHFMENQIFGFARNVSKVFGWTKPSSLALLCDFKTQNGSITLLSKKVNQIVDLAPKHEDLLEEIGIELDNFVNKFPKKVQNFGSKVIPVYWKELFQEFELEDEAHQAKFLAFVRSLGSSRKWYKDVLSRKWTIAQGWGEVHGISFDLYDWRL